jgi:hypothetical protein
MGLAILESSHQWGISGDKLLSQPKIEVEQSTVN